MGVDQVKLGSASRLDNVTNVQTPVNLRQVILTVAPILSSPTINYVAETTAEVEFTTDLANEGDLIVRVHDTADTPTEADLLAGTGAVASQSVRPAGTEAFAFTLTTGNSYKAHAVHRCGGIVSNISSTPTFTPSTDDTAPVLTNAGATAPDNSTIDWSVDTDEGNGVLEVELRLASDGSVIETQTVDIPGVGTETGQFTELADTDFIVAFVHTDRAGNASDEVTAEVSTSPGFYTLAPNEYYRTASAPGSHTGITIRYRGTIPLAPQFTWHMFRNVDESYNMDISSRRFDITAIKTGTNGRIPSSGAESPQFAADADTELHEYLFVADSVLGRFAIYEDGGPLYDNGGGGAAGNLPQREIELWDREFYEAKMAGFDIWLESRFDGQVPSGTPWASDGGDGVNLSNLVKLTV